MTRDHKIRIAVAGLAGKVREDAILALLTRPETINAAMVKRLTDYHENRKPRERKCRPRGPKRDVNLSIRVTYDEYCVIRDRLKRRPITPWIRKRLGIA